MSRLHQVVGPASRGTVAVVDVNGMIRRVSLLALDGPEPSTGDWLVVHSGYAVDRADSTEAEEIAAALSQRPPSETNGPAE